MSWRQKQLKQSSLYLILDAQVLSCQELLAQLKPAVRAGVDIVQLRHKNGSAAEILDFCKQAKKICRNRTLFILNDRVDLALLAQVDGVHLGQDDISYVDARKMMGKKAIIGVSCQTLDQVKVAQRQGVDYIGFGSIFKTKTKPERQPMKFDLLAKVLETAKIPLFPIGGINLNNLTQITPLGVRRVAVCRDILLAKDVEQAVKEFNQILRE